MAFTLDLLGKGLKRRQCQTRMGVVLRWREGVSMPVAAMQANSSTGERSTV